MTVQLSSISFNISRVGVQGGDEEWRWYKVSIFGVY